MEIIFFGYVYTDYDNWGFGDFVVGFINKFNYLINDYNDVTFNFGFLGNISTTQFITPNNALFTFVSFISNCLLILGCVSWFYFTILDLSTLNVDNIVKDKEDLVIL